MSAKNQLQEFCISKKYNMPRYESQSFGPHHRPEWSSVVLVNELTFRSDGVYPTKVLAEQSAALVAFTSLNTPSSAFELKEIHVIKPPNWIILVDVENLKPPILLNKPIEYHIFLSDFASVDLSQYQSPISTIYKVDSSNSDAADHLMSFTAGKLLISRPEIRNYMIVSRDKAMATLATLIQDEGCNVVHFKDLVSLQNFLDKL